MRTPWAETTPNEPYRADDHYPGGAHNEQLIAVDLVLAIAGREQPDEAAIADCVTEAEGDRSVLALATNGGKLASPPKRPSH